MVLMGFFSRFKAKLSNTTHDLSSQAKAIFGKPVTEPAHSSLINAHTAEFALLTAMFEEWVNDAYKRNEVVSGSLNLIMNTFLEAPLGVRDARTGEWLEQHDALTLFDHINDGQTKREFLKELVLHLYLGSIAFIEKVKTNRGVVTELGLLRPDKVQIRTNGHSIDHYIYFPATKPIAVPLDNIVFLKFTDPMNKFKGHSPLHSLATRIDTENESTKLTKTALENGGVPGTIIKFAGHRHDDEKRSAARSFTNRFSGDSHGSALAIDEDVMDISPFGSSIKDLDKRSLMEVDEARILSSLGVPLPIYGSISGQAASTHDNMKTSLRLFWMHTIIPLQTMIEDFLNNDDDLTHGKTIKFAFDRRNIDALNQEQDAVSFRAREDYKANIITLNEARAAGDYESVEDGDEINQPVANPFAGFGQEDSEEEKSESRQDRINSLLEINEWDCKEEVKDESVNDTIPTEPVVTEEVHKEEDECCEVSEAIESPSNDRDLLAEFKTASNRFRLADAAALPLVRMVDSELKQQIKDFQAAIGEKQGKALKTFEQSRLEDDLQILQNQWEIRLHADSLPLMTKLVEETAKQASASVGSSFDIESEEIQQAIKTEQFKFANRVSKSSSKQIRQVIKAGFDEGKTLGELSTDIKELGSVWQNGGRADTIARTETAKAANGGAKLAYRQAGVTKLRYTAVLDDNTTEICKSLDGTIVGIEEKFLSAEDGFTDSKGNAADLSYNDGVPNAGDAHPNCRSTIVPVFESTDGGF